MDNDTNDTDFIPSNKTITARQAQFRIRANVVGWHVHVDDSYLGFHEKSLTEIVAENSDSRLTWIGGNVLGFEW